MRYRRAKRLELQLLVLLALPTGNTLNDRLELFLVKIGFRIHWDAFFVVDHLVSVLIIHAVLLLDVRSIFVLDDHLSACAFDNTLSLLVTFIITVVGAVHICVQPSLVALSGIVVLRVRLVQTIFFHLIGFLQS